MPSNIITEKEKNKIKKRIKTHEGLRFKSYHCSEGKLTAGYGRNLENVPFTQGEVDLMFDNDFARAERGAESLVVYEYLNETRKGVIIEMIFQMGLAGVKKFRLFLDAARRGDWSGAKREMLDSKWAEQTPKRAKELARIFYKG